ncbi:MAG: hypothetical protein R2729_17835 [Bryobacteraceae bacterium]
MRLPIVLAGALPLLIAAGAGIDASSAKRKIQSIESERLPAGSRITFSTEEINAYAAAQVSASVGDAIREPRLEFDSGRATGSATVDFVRLQTQRGQPPGTLLRWMLKGEKPVSVRVRFRSANGEGQVDVEEVSISGVPLSGRALDLLIDYYLRPRYPEVAIGEPFDLRHKVEQIDLTALGVLVRIGK